MKTLAITLALLFASCGSAQQAPPKPTFSDKLDMVLARQDKAEADLKASQEQVKALAARLAGLEDRVQRIFAEPVPQAAAVAPPKPTAPKADPSKCYNLGGCICGCVETGSCDCKNCNTPKQAPRAAAPKMQPTCPGCGCGCALTGECVCSTVFYQKAASAPSGWLTYEQARAACEAGYWTDSEDNGATWYVRGNRPRLFRGAVRAAVSMGAGSCGVGGCR